MPDPNPTDLAGCRNPACGYGAPVRSGTPCPSCCLTPDEVEAGFEDATELTGGPDSGPSFPIACRDDACGWHGSAPAWWDICPRCKGPVALAAASAPEVGSPDPTWLAALCYCGDPRDEHSRNAGPCLMVRDGARCECEAFEAPRDLLPVDLLPATTDGPPWSGWPSGPGEEDAPLPGDDPDEARVYVEATDLGTVVAEWGDAIVTELREGLGSNVPNLVDGGVHPASLDLIVESLEIIRENTRRTLGAYIARAAVTVLAACVFVTFLWMLIGASTIAGVMTP